MLFTRLGPQKFSRYILKPTFMPNFRFSQIKQVQSLSFGEVDLGCVQAALEPPSQIVETDIITKISYFSPNSVYQALDVFSRDSLIYIADDLNCGMSVGILAISIGIKLLFSPFMVMAQMNAIKMKLIEPETQNFQAQQQKIMQEYAKNKIAKIIPRWYRELRLKHNISFLTPLLSISQVPVLMTWFFSLRYVTSLPDQYPGIKSQGLLWFKDLSEYEPYGVIAVTSALLTFWNMSLNPNLATGGSNPLGRYYRYLRFLPFLSIPIVVFFPAGINLYWCSSALVQLIVTGACRSEQVRMFFGIPQYLPGTILEKLHQKQTQNIVRAVIKEQTSEQKQKQVPIEQIAGGIPLRVANIQTESKSQVMREQIIKQSEQTADKVVVKLYSQKPKKNKN